jgi:hypothetical protein
MEDFAEAVIGKPGDGLNTEQRKLLRPLSASFLMNLQIAHELRESKPLVGSSRNIRS